MDTETKNAVSARLRGISQGQLAVLGGSVAVPFWLASGLLFGLAPVFVWIGRCKHEGPRGCTLAFGSQEAR